MKVKVVNSEQGEINQLNLDLATRIEGECTVGRSPNSGLILDSADVSRLHGKFFLQDGNYYFCDFGSRNGSLVNGELAQTNQSYMLKPGDVVRIGDFVLIMEEISEEPEELPVTVFRGIDATVIAGWRSAAKFDTPEVANKAPEPVSEVPEVMAPTPEAVREVTEYEITYVQAPEEFGEIVVYEVTTIQAPEEVSEATDAIAPTPEAASEASGEVEAPEVVSQVPSSVSEVSEATIIQTPEAAEVFDRMTQAPEEVNEIPEVTSFQDVTIIQAPEEVESVEVTSEPAPEPATQAPEEVSEATDAIAPTPEAVSEASGEVEAPEVVSQVPSSVSEVSEATIIQDLTTIQIPSAAFDFDVITPAPEEPEAAAVSEVTTIQAPEALRQVPESEAEPEVTSDTAPEAVREVTEPVTQAPQEESEASEASTQTLEALLSEASGEVEAPEVVSQVTSLVSEVPEVTSIQAPPEAFDFDVITPAPEEPEEAAVSEGTTIQAPEAVSAVPELVTPPPEEAAVSYDITQAPEEAEVSEVMAPPPEAASKAFEIISKKHIALMAHDSKKSDLAQFVAQHKDFLSKCLTIATPSISETLYQQTGLAISQKTPSIPVGGYQAIASLVGGGDILAVIFLRDFMVTQSGQANEEALVRLCNINQILLATNVPTAEAIMHYIKDMVASL